MDCILNILSYEEIWLIWELNFESESRKVPRKLTQPESLVSDIIKFGKDLKW